MLISLRHGFVLIEVPKTGTSSLRRLLLPHADVIEADEVPRRHQSWVETQMRHAPLFVNRPPGSFVKIAVVRHPVDWALSWHAYTAADHPFEDWWRSPHRFTFMGWRCPNQISRVVGYTGRVEMDWLVPFEALATLPAAFGRLGLPEGSLPHCNRNPVPKAEIPPRLRREIEDELGADLDLYQRARKEWKP